MEIRPYLECDEAAVAALWTNVFVYAAPHNEPRLVIRKKLEVDRELFLVAVDDGRPVGTVIGGYDGHRGWIYSLAVDPAHRRKGVATALVRTVEQALAGRGCPKVNLQILASNADVAAFYCKLGYAVEDRISMGKLL